MSGTLAGRVALITGAGRGVGAAIARALHAAGASVVIADNGTSIAGEGADPTVARAFAGELGARAVAFAESIASPSAAQAAVDKAVQAFGGLDIVVNAAAILRDAFLFKADPAAWDAVIQTNLSGAFHVLAAATPVLRERAKAAPGTGRIINVISTAGLYGNYGQAAYAAAKAGLVGLTRVAALDMARSGVTANAIAPFAATRVTESIKPANDAQAAYKERALRVGAEHVGRFAAFLASFAAKDVTGQVFGVRAREVFLFSQARSIAKLIRPDDDAALARAVAAEFAPRFTPLETDLEAFNSEPVS
ncbi:MAG: SDR family NAD(P)-dependent oxidoreductase [Alphaproteobacteria bacterium]|nr:SDR family NAD(P)-dependent oxidoreductase [Alphaproteobacteria bacterium]